MVIIYTMNRPEVGTKAPLNIVLQLSKHLYQYQIPYLQSSLMSHSALALPQ